MKKYFKYTIVFILTMFLLINHVGAISTKCDYSVKINGKEFKYRIEIVNIDDELITNSSKRNAQNNNYWSKHFIKSYYNFDRGNYDTISTRCKSADKYNIVKGQICVLSTDEDKKDFFVAGISGSSFSCPSMYQYAPNPSHPDEISFIANKTKVVTKNTDNSNGNNTAVEPSTPDITIYEGKMDCSDILGPNLTKIVHLVIKLVRIAGAVITILQATLALLPAVSSGDADALNKALKKCVTLGIILAVIGLFPTLLHLIGNLCGFDLTCIA